MKVDLTNEAIALSDARSIISDMRSLVVASENEYKQIASEDGCRERHAIDFLIRIEDDLAFRLASHIKTALERAGHCACKGRSVAVGQ